jgi:lipopolysaccharide transport system permease protein
MGVTTTVEPTRPAAVPAAEPDRADAVHSQSSDLPIVVIDASPRWDRWLADVRQYRGALYSLAWRNVRSRYKQAVLGMSWAVIQPMVQVGVFTILFGILARVPTGDVPYPVFALAALIPWNLFAKLVSDGAQSLVTNQHIVTKLFFPRIFLVLAAGASAFIDAAVASVMLIVFMIAYGVLPGLHVWLILPAFLGLVLFAYGFASLLAAVNARWRDVQHTVPFLLQIGMLATPVLYPANILPERWRWIATLNPMTGWVSLFRSAVLGAPLPDGQLLLQSCGLSLLLAVFGFWYFTRAERTVVDVV